MKFTTSIPVVLFLILVVLSIFFPFSLLYAIITLSVYTITILIKEIKKSQSKAKEQTPKLHNEEEEEGEKESDENNVFLEDKFFRDDSYEDDDAIKDDDTIKDDDGIADAGIYYA